MDTIKPSIPEALKYELTEYEREGGWFQNGLAEGVLRGQRKALFAAIEARGLPLTDGQRTTLEACADERQLDRWLRRLFQVDTAEAMLADT